MDRLTIIHKSLPTITLRGIELLQIGPQIHIYTSARSSEESLLGNTLTHPRLAALRRKGLGNGRWTQLSTAERALFKCALWVARVRGKIRNINLAMAVLRIWSKLSRMVDSPILRAGKKRALMMRQVFAKIDGVLEWAPQAGEWLQDNKFIWYLGILAINP